jgi:hypothetical protein
MSDTIRARTARVKIYQGDDLAEIAALDRAARSARGSGQDSASMLMADQAEWFRLAQEHDALVDEAEKRVTVVVLRALGRRQWRELVEKHPPRTGNETDAAVGVDESTFPDVIVPACMVEPVHATDVDREAFLDSLSSADFDRLYLTAFSLNRAQGADPKASLVSELTPRSESTSK